MTEYAGRVAAITGAGSGIGRALAERLARLGATLALSDINAESLAETQARCKKLGSTPTSTMVVDVADRNLVERWADQVAHDHGTVNYIFNNAGVALGAEVSSMSYEDLEWLMGINFWGVVYGTKAFLPHLKASGDGHVVNFSSSFGLLSVPTQSAYNASKFGVRAFTDTLRMELAIEGAPVVATTVIPGRVSTNLSRNARIDENVIEVVGSPAEIDPDDPQWLKMSPDTAARRILRSVRHNRRRALIGPDAYAVDLLSRLPARIYETVLITGFKYRNRQLGITARSTGASQPLTSEAGPT